MPELAITYSVHPNMIALWKRQTVENAAALFEKEGKNKANEEASREKDELFRQIGQLQVENEYLKKNTNNCTGDRSEMEAILEVLKEKPFYGYRRIARELS